MRTIALAVLIWSAATGAWAESLVLGVLEEPQCAKNPERAVRILFEKTGPGWAAVNDDSGRSRAAFAKMTWAAALHGRILGTVETVDATPDTKYLNDWHYRREKVFRVISAPVPLIKNSEHAFSGWCTTPSTRPLVVLTRPATPDPNRWRPIPQDAGLQARLYGAVKLVVGRFNAIHCPDGETVAPYAFQPRDLRISARYRSARGQELIAIGLDHDHFGCDGPSPPEWTPQWFLTDGPSLEHLGHEMELVDIGDYDGDGTSEMLFWHSGHNRGGYRLLFDSLRRQVRYEWGYH